MANQTRIINIDGMTCGGCVSSVHTATSEIDGLESITINLSDKCATVTFDDDKTSAETIAAAIDDAGFEASVASAQQQLQYKKPAITAGFLLDKSMMIHF